MRAAGGLILNVCRGALDLAGSCSLLGLYKFTFVVWYCGQLRKQPTKLSSRVVLFFIIKRLKQSQCFCPTGCVCLAFYKTQWSFSVECTQ